MLNIVALQQLWTQYMLLKGIIHKTQHPPL